MSEEWRYDEQSGTFRPSGERYQYTQHTQRREEKTDWGSWVLIGIMFAIGLWPVGLFMLIAKLNDKPKKRTYTTTTTTRTTTTTERTSGVRRTQQRTATRETKVTQAAKKVTRTPSDTNKSAKLRQIIGGVLTALFGVFAVSEVGALLGGTADLAWLLQCLGFVAGGVTMFLSGRKMQHRRSRIERYLAFIGERDYVTVDELMMITGKKRNVVEKDVDYMLQKHMFATGAFFDAGRGVLFRSADAYQRYLQERTKKENLTPKEANEGYSGALRAIREANDRIPDPIFSEKLDHMEEIAGKIFREVEAHPEKQKQASTFFDYYLPTTLKLLGTYTEFEEAGIEGENLRQAKSRIESIMDTLLENFEKQLDELYRSEAMDVDADIRVMETMLDRDLSSVERDFGLNGGAAVQSKPN